MDKQAKIYVAGHLGLVGSALVRKLKSVGYTNLVYRSRNELDLLDQLAVNDFFDLEKPEYVFLAAAKVGGILANDTYRADFIYENLQIQCNVIHASHRNGVKKLLFLGSSCIYPKDCEQPMKESSLLTGPLESTNEPYAIAKLAGLKLCESYNRQYNTQYISVMPTNLYGPNDTYDLQNSHVIPALLQKFHEAKVNGASTVEIWGSGTPKREFLYVDDMADACVFVMRNHCPFDCINIGYGEDLSIMALSSIIKSVVGFTGEIVTNTTKPDGVKQKLLDHSRLKTLGWTASTSLQEGLMLTYEDFLSR